MYTLSKNMTGAVLGLAALAFLAIAMTVEAGGQKVRVCHVTGSESNPTVEIVISENAVASHLEHGDMVWNEETGCTSDGGGGNPN